MWRGRGSGGCCLPASGDIIRNKDFAGNESAASRPAGEEGAGRGLAGGRERSPVAFAPNARRPDLAFAGVERRGDDARFRIPPAPTVVLPGLLSVLVAAAEAVTRPAATKVGPAFGEIGEHQTLET